MTFSWLVLTLPGTLALQDGLSSPCAVPGHWGGGLQGTPSFSGHPSGCRELVGAGGNLEGLNPADTRTYGGTKWGLAGPAGGLAEGLPDGGVGLEAASVPEPVPALELALELLLVVGWVLDYCHRWCRSRGWSRPQPRRAVPARSGGAAGAGALHPAGSVTPAQRGRPHRQAPRAPQAGCRSVAPAPHPVHPEVCRVGGGSRTPPHAARPQASWRSTGRPSSTPSPATPASRT